MSCCEPYIFEKFYSAIITVKTIPFLPSHGAKVEPSRLYRCCRLFTVFTEQRPLVYGYGGLIPQILLCKSLGNTVCNLIKYLGTYLVLYGQTKKGQGRAKLSALSEIAI